MCMHTFRPHGQKDVGNKALACSDLAGNLERNLDGDQVDGTSTIDVFQPGVCAADEVLALYVQEALGPANGCDKALLNGELDCAALACAGISGSQKYCRQEGRKDRAEFDCDAAV